MVLQIEAPNGHRLAKCRPHRVRATKGRLGQALGESFSFLQFNLTSNPSIWKFSDGLIFSSKFRLGDGTLIVNSALQRLSKASQSAVLKTKSLFRVSQESRANLAFAHPSVLRPPEARPNTSVPPRDRSKQETRKEASSARVCALWR